MSNPFQETYFNTKSKTKYRKHSLEIDPKNDPYMQMLMSLYQFQQKWIAKEGALPEEVDRHCIDLLGMRFALLIEIMWELYSRQKLIESGQISDFETHLFRMDLVGGESHEISKEQHEVRISCMNQLLEHSNNLIPFFDSLSDFAI